MVSSNAHVIVLNSSAMARRDAALCIPPIMRQKKGINDKIKLASAYHIS
jgi:hypothetical protein